MSQAILPWLASTSLMVWYVFSATAYALNPTGRYLLEMGRLIRDPQLQRSSIGMNSVATPLRPSEETAATYDHDLASFVPATRSSSSVFDGPMPTQARINRFEQSKESQYYATLEPQDYATPETEYDLFDALNRHIEALDEQIETSTSLRSVLDEQFSSVEVQTDFDDPEYMYEQIDVSYTETEDPTFYEEPADLQQSFSDGASQMTLPSVIGDTGSFGFSINQADFMESFETPQPRKSQFLSIQKRRGPPPLPDTIDPYELLGFSYEHPPQDADEVRRAYVRCAKKYHPDAIDPNSTSEEKELAALNFKRINDAYRKLKDQKTRLQNEYFATTMGGAMYEPRGSSRHIRRPFSHGYDFDDSGSIFSSSYSAKHGTKYGETRRFWEKRKSSSQDDWRQQHRSSHVENKGGPFRARQEVRHNCHVSGQDYPPFFSH
ncbi:hypothetical protein HJC23_003806 [Cyclotella cryptica]|uniref:J domain-containing protein n=1 Tax=Cyclotella cryptica TaxID=29204 RepID=A0ABD3Q1F2_9STRA|eukprot:CCRYP_009951-RA/>CCRYP_009951-RA protein AED:0.09 eAED:0.09 QI:0/-1/0/1/-1/1/1/0/434